jgi:molybdopterin molybdotransferase
VHRRPRVGILTSGDELVSLDRPDDILSGRRLADANGPALGALVHEAGAIAVPLGIARDDPAELERIVRDSDDIDMLITAGGVSVGEHDHVRAVMAARGAVMVFERVRIRPGGPTAFAVLPDGRPWLALPGNPVSAIVTFELFGRPAIRAMAGHRDPCRPVRHAVLQGDVRRDASLDQYVRCTFAWPAEDGLPAASLTGPQGSGMLMSVARAEGLVIIRAGNGLVAAGSRVEAIFLT